MTVQVDDAYLLARLRDTTWVTNNLANGYSGFTNDFDCSAIGSTPDGAVWGVFRYGYSFPRTFVYGSSLNRFRSDSQVTVVTIASVVEGGIGAASGCVDGQDSVHSCYELYAGLYLDEEEIDTTTAYQTSIRFDSLGRPQIAYVAANGGLLYRYRDAGVWHIFDLRIGGVTALGLMIGENLQPIIAYTTSAGVFLAHGVDVAGQSEEQREPTVYGSPLTASVTRNVLRVPVSPFTIHTSLFDMAGRRVADLRPGPNDVSGLSPGVYFVKEAQAQAVRKVVITR
jgi:hypothetical protein